MLINKHLMDESKCVAAEYQVSFFLCEIQKGVCYPEYDNASFPSKLTLLQWLVDCNLICITEGNNHILIFMSILKCNGSNL